MTATELLSVIHRDIGQQIQNAIQFKMSDHLARDARIAVQISKDIQTWIQGLIEANLDDAMKDGIYQGTREDWIWRCQGAEDKLLRIQEILAK